MSAVPGIDKVLVANRGEIAVRICRTLRRLGIASAVVHHRVDAGTPATRAADEAIEIEGAEPIAAYLDAEQIVAVAKRIGADALHPGYGFLSENAGFAKAVEAAGVRFIGPTPEAMRLMGDKIESRNFVRARGFHIAPSAVEEEDPKTFLERARTVGFPLLIKASAGGGGKGMHIVREDAALAQAVSLARSEAQRYFKDGRLYAERYVERPRHIEVQVMGDQHGHCVHLFERECSIQRRFQKLVEESPAPGLPLELRDRICREGAGIAAAAHYVGAGTVEFVLAQDGEFYFLEMNTRLQVEHPVTELVTGIDLVETQVRVAAGEPLPFRQEDLVRRGAAIECRVCAEDADAGFLPVTGDILAFAEPRGEGIRFDGGIAGGQAVTAAFDPMLGKLIAYGDSRSQAIERARGALRDTVVLGVTTNAAFLERVLGHDAFAAAKIDTGFVVEHADSLRPAELGEEQRRAVLAAAALVDRDFLERVRAVPEPHASIGWWRN